ncbi:MAG: aminopeptidase N [Bdellovibrionales bacterium]|nr:aminopeptidase N [Bdellovibrionales bacterium]
MFRFLCPITHTAVGLLIFSIIGCSTQKTVESSETAKIIQAELAESNLSLQAAISRAQHVSQVRYQLEFSLPEKESEYSGTSQIQFHFLPGAAEPLRIDFYGGKIKKLSVNDGPVNPDYNGRELFIPSSTLREGANTIEISFTKSYARDGRGLARFEDPEDKRVYTYSNLEPYDANRVFPCFDQPDLKATYAMRVTAPKAWQVISSVRESSAKENSPHSKLWIFPESARFSTYVWSLHAGPYKVWTSSAGNVPLRLFARQSLAKYVKTEEWFPITQKGLSFFSRYFDYPYPYGKYDQLIVPEFNAGAMENVGAVTFNENFIRRGPKSDREKLGLADTILHEMAHMWFGNLVTMKWWNDLWLNESFATYMSYLALSKATDFKHLAWRTFHGTKSWAYWEDQLVTTHPIEAQVPDTRQAFANFDGITYGKGASVIKQISFFIGPEKFQQGVQKYFRKYANGNTELKDFMNSLREAYGTDLSAWQREWLQTASLNTVESTLVCDKNKVKMLNIEQSAPSDYPYLRSHRFKLAFFNPKVNARKSGVHADQIFSVLLKDKQIAVPEAAGKPCPLLVYPNYEDYGYMKIKLDERSLAELPKHIHEITDPFDRQLFWSALWDMVRDANLNLYKFADLAIENLNQEKDPDTLRDIVRYLLGRGSNQASVLYYLPNSSLGEKKIYDAFAQKIERAVFRQLLIAHPSSEIQKVWLDSFIRSARTEFGLSKLKALLAGDLKLTGLPIDQDKRWDIIEVMASHNYSEPLLLIEKESVRDPSSSGKQNRMNAQASIATWEAKQPWLNELTKKRSDYSFDQLRNIISSLFPRHQVALRELYAKDFYQNLAVISKERDGSFAEEYAELAPSECSSQETSRISNFLRDHGAGLHPSVEKALKVARQEDDRCRKIQSLLRDKTPNLNF